MSPRVKTILKYAAKLTVTVLLLVLVFRQTNVAELREAFSGARWSLVGWVWLINVIEFWILSFNMRLILKRQDCDVPTFALFATSSVTALYGLVLPGMLDSSVKWYILKRYTGKGIHVFSGMAYSQVASMFMTLFAAMGALALTQPTGDIRWSFLCVGLMVFLLAFFVLLFSSRTGPKFLGLLRRTIKWFPNPLRTIGNRVLDQLRVFQDAPWTFHLSVAGLHFAGLTVLGTSIYVLAARAAWIGAPIASLIWIGFFVYILGRLPISIANLGWREWTLTGLLGLYGADASAVLVMSTILLSNKFVLAALGACFQIHWTLRGDREAITNADETPPPNSCP